MITQNTTQTTEDIRLVGVVIHEGNYSKHEWVFNRLGSSMTYDFNGEPEDSTTYNTPKEFARNLGSFLRNDLGIRGALDRRHILKQAMRGKTITHVGKHGYIYTNPNVPTI